MNNKTDVLGPIKQHLKDYLAEHGRAISGNRNVRCVNSMDRHPSASYLKGSGSPVLWCHGCKKAYDIFDCAHFLEDKPLEGRGFFKDNVMYLADKFGIEVKQNEVTEDQKEIMIKMKTHRHAADFIVKGYDSNSQVSKDLGDRGITDTIAKRLLIGGIESYDKYLNHMLEMGWTEPTLSSMGLTNRSIFKPRNIIFCVCNEHGSPVGFAARDVTWTKEKPTPKYTNSPNSDIYQKGHLLFNIHRAKQYKDGPIYVVEGYVDTATLDSVGINNVCSIGSTTFTKDHIRSLSDLGVKRLWFVLDGDDGGNDGIRLALDRITAFNVFDEIKIIKLPSGQDPDSFIKTFGAEAFTELEKMTGFEWTLDHMSHDADPEIICTQAIPMILSQENLVVRERMVKTLSNRTGVTETAIKAETDRILGSKETIKIREIDGICEGLKLNLTTKKNGDSPIEIISNALSKIKKVEKAYDANADLQVEYKSYIKMIKNKCKEDRALDGFPLNRFSKLQNALDGYPDHGCLMALGGKPGAGKTSLLRNVMWDLVTTNDNCMVLFMSIDDNRDRVLPALVAMDQEIPIRMVKKYSTIRNTDLLARWEAGWRRVEQHASQMIIRDASHGTTIDAMERYAEYMMEKNPDKKLAIVLDNFHLLTDYPHLGIREQNKQRSERLKKFTTEYKVPLIMTVELKKNDQGKPTMDSIMETGAVSYDSDVILLLHNDLHMNPESQTYWTYHDKIDQEHKKMPFLELIFAKNIEGDFSSKSLYFKFLSHMTRAEEHDGLIPTGGIDRSMPSRKWQDSPR